MSFILLYNNIQLVIRRFAVDLLQQTRSSSELNTVLNYDPDDHSLEPTKHLARLEQAIRYKQKEFVAHPHVQQLLAAIWYLIKLLYYLYFILIFIFIIL